MYGGFALLAHPLLKKKKQLTGKSWRIQEIREIFVTLVHVGSRKHLQLFCFYPCPFFFKEVVGHK